MNSADHDRRVDSLVRQALPPEPVPAAVRQDLLSVLDTARRQWAEPPAPIILRFWPLAAAAGLVLALLGGWLYHRHAPLLSVDPANGAMATTNELSEPTLANDGNGRKSRFSLGYREMDYPLAEFYAETGPSRWANRQLIYVNPSGKRVFMIVYQTRGATTEELP